MISLDQIRKLEPTLAGASDEKVAEIRERLYGLGQLAYESWVDESGSKIPLGLKEIDLED